MSGSAPLSAGEPDYRRLFAEIPSAYLVMDVNLVIVDANAAYLRLLGRRREELVGRWVFDAFPPTPDALDGHGRNPLQVSFESARDTGQPDVMPLFKYSVVEPESGEVVERHWSLISSAVRGVDGRVALVVQRVEDVTDYVREHSGQRAQLRLGLERVQAVEADLFLQVERLRAVQQERDQSARRLASLNEVALALTAADSVEDLEQVVIGRGMTMLGADGGGITTADEHGGWRITVSPVLGEHVQARYARVAADSPLPAVHTARTGVRVELPTVADGLTAFPIMSGVYEETGRRGWVFLPLTVKGECLGSLAVSWVQERRLLPEELDLLEGFAAQCAQALSRLQARDTERRTAAADRRMSETLQRSLLTEPVQPDHLQIAVRYLPAADDAQVGGDWYDAFLTSDGATSLVIGDVSGHDRDAAAIMGQVRNLIRGIGYTVGDPPAPVLTRLDRALRDLGVDALVTMVLAQVEQDEQAAEQGLRVLHWSNAGHPPPLLLHPDGRGELLRTEPDLLIGLDVDTLRQSHRAVLTPGCTVLLYTDGLVERRGACIEDGLQWLTQTCQEMADLPLEVLCDQLLAVLGDAQDDVALLAVRAHPEDRPKPVGPARRAEAGSVDRLAWTADQAQGDRPDTQRQQARAHRRATPGAHGELRDRVFHLQIPVDDPGGVRTARRAAADVVDRWDVQTGISDDVALVVSELMTNAVVHGRSDAVLRLLRQVGSVRVEVLDEDTRLPVLVAPDWQSLSGRGMALVASLSTLWGAERTATGKIVWAEFEVLARHHP